MVKNYETQQTTQLFKLLIVQTMLHDKTPMGEKQNKTVITNIYIIWIKTK